MVISFDCLLYDTRLKFFGKSDFIYKAFISICFSVFLVLIYCLIGLLLKLLFWKWIILKRLLIVALITIVFTQYSATSATLLNFFNCRTIEEEILLWRDLQTVCWKGAHLIWTLIFGLPGLLIMLVIIPVFGTIFLLFKKNKSDDPLFMQYYILLYQGYNKETIYWEFCNIVWKIILAVFLAIIPQS